jgi:hypothetical protein
MIYKIDIMKTISLKIDESIITETENITETEKILTHFDKSRNRYINEAIDYFNKLQKRILIEQKLRIESELVKDDSIKVLKDFEEMDYAE